MTSGITTFTLIHVLLSLIGIVLALFVWLGRAALKGFPAEAGATARAGLAA